MTVLCHRDTRLHRPTPGFGRIFIWTTQNQRFGASTCGHQFAILNPESMK
jgi:hypothetical protein